MIKRNYIIVEEKFQLQIVGYALFYGHFGVHVLYVQFVLLLLLKTLLHFLFILLLDLGLARGPGHLHRVYNRYFRHPTLPALLESSVVAQKEWVLVIRSAREATDLFAYDAFAISPSLRAWIGLPPLPEA